MTAPTETGGAGAPVAPPTPPAVPLAAADRVSGRGVSSRQVSWWPTHEFITALTAHLNEMPVAGTPAWCRLDDTNPVKLLALAAAGEHHVLRMETAQEAQAEASRAIAGAVDWPKVAREIRQGRGTAYIRRRIA